jgi:hypothetical protein
MGSIQLSKEAATKGSTRHSIYQKMSSWLFTNVQPPSYRLVAQEHQAAFEQLAKEFEAKLNVAVNERVQEAKEALTACHQ